MRRLNVNINPECEEALQVLSIRYGVTITEVIRRAIGVYKYAADQALEGNVMAFIPAVTSRSCPTCHLRMRNGDEPTCAVCAGEVVALAERMLDGGQS